jgi:hypothetical protein
MSETINGWAPPVYYDKDMQEYRVATQDDMNRLQEIEGDYETLRSVMHEAMLDIKKSVDGFLKEIEEEPGS